MEAVEGQGLRRIADDTSRAQSETSLRLVKSTLRQLVEAGFFKTLKS